MARANAVTASSQGPEAAFYNPAGLGWSSMLQIEVGYLHAFSRLRYQTSQGSSNRSIAMPDYVGVGILWPVLPWLSVGFASYLPTAAALRIDQRSVDAPYYPFLENRSQRLSLFPAFSIRPWSWLSVGFGLNFFSAVTGDIVTTEGPTRATESTIVADANARASCTAGVAIQVRPWLRLSLVYRQAFGVPYTITTRNLVGGTPLDVAVRGEALQTPEEFIIGSAVTLRSFQLSFDAAWRMWHEVSNPFVDVDAVVSGIDLGLRIPETPYRDTLALRTGIAIPHAISSSLGAEYRLGASLETSQVREQEARTNLIDAPKIGLSTGVGFSLPKLLTLPIRIDVHAGFLYQISRRYDKRVRSPEDARQNPNVLADEDSDTAGIQISNPGYPYLVGDALVLTTGITLAVALPP